MKKNIYVCPHLIIFLISVGVIISSCSGSTTQPTDVELLSAIENAFVSIAKRSKPAIVGVSAERRVDGKRAQQEGSGFIFRKDGYILTNDHVVKDAIAIRIRLLDGSTSDAKLVGTDPNTDIAVLKIDAKEEYPVLRLADSEQVQVGQFRDCDRKSVSTESHGNNWHCQWKRTCDSSRIRHDSVPRFYSDRRLD